MLDLEMIGQGATTNIYRDGGTAIKLYANASYDEVCSEAERQRFAHGAGLPVPGVYGVRRLDGNAVALDMAYINGQPLMRPGMDKDERRNALHTLVKLQCIVHRVDATHLRKQSDVLTWKINHSQFMDDPLKKALVALLNRLDKNAVSLCHGDFHPLNILYDGQKHWIIDWVDATAGNPLADACRTYLIFKQHMARSAGIYLRAFCETAGAKQEDVLAWLPVVAAARLDENIDNKTRLWLLNLIKT